MHLGLILDMTESGLGDRTAITSEDSALSYRELAERSWAASARLAELEAPSVVYLGPNHLAFPVALFGAAGIGVPLIPLNYRLGADQLRAQIAAHPGALVIHDGAGAELAEAGRAIDREEFLDSLKGVPAEAPLPVDPELPCLLLYTSGTTAAPKAAVLRHRHLMAYLLGTVEFASAEETDASLVCVPPYHIAGVANLLSNLYAGRRIIYLDRFDPAVWLDTVRREQVTQAMVIPTMLARVVEHLGGAADAGTPSLRALSYGGSRMPAPVLERALDLFADTGFVNAYGLTETSSTIALLSPEDHRAAFSSQDPSVRERLASAGRLVPGIELEVRDETGQPLPTGEAGLIYLRGEQISGEYEGGGAPESDGWFCTRDRGWIDAEGYLFIEGRADDTIIRGGENIAPAEIEDVLLAHPCILDAVVVGLPDDEWGQRLVAVVVCREGEAVVDEELKGWVRDRLRSSKTPETVEFWRELPRTETGKLIRRNVVAQLEQ